MVGKSGISKSWAERVAMAPIVGVTLQVIDHENEHAAAKAMVTKLWEQWAER